MRAICVVTDSAACLPPDLVEALEIEVIPFSLVWEGQVLRDGLDITPQEVYRRLPQAETLPRTSQPSLGEFLELYRRLQGRCSGILSIHVPASLSGTVSTARAAAQELETPVEVLDCGAACMAQGFVVLAAARAPAAGADLAQASRAAREALPRTRLYATLPRLDYLARQGRIPSLYARLGGSLNIQPVLTIGGGRIGVAARVRSRQRAVEHLLARITQDGRAGSLRASVFHADADEEASDPWGRSAAARTAGSCISPSSPRSWAPTPVPACWASPTRSSSYLPMAERPVNGPTALLRKRPLRRGAVIQPRLRPANISRDTVEVRVSGLAGFVLAKIAAAQPTSGSSTIPTSTERPWLQTPLSPSSGSAR